jgi:GDP-L-fucose synthase
MTAEAFPLQKVTSWPAKIEPLEESMLHPSFEDGQTVAPQYMHEGYAYAKRMQAMMNSAYRKQYSVNFTSVIPADAYGPDDNYKQDDHGHEHVIASLIHKCHVARETGEPLVVDGAADSVRQFVQLDDLARLMVWAILKVVVRTVWSCVLCAECCG